MTKTNKLILIVAVLIVAMLWYFTEKGIIGKKKEQLEYSYGSLNFNNPSEVVSGCTDPSAENYEPTATWDNGMCFYEMGCCDTNATNYNPSADSCNLPNNNLLNCQYS